MLAFAKVVKAAKAPAKVESASNIHTLTETKSRRKVPSATAAAADACTWARSAHFYFWLRRDCRVPPPYTEARKVSCR